MQAQRVWANAKRELQRKAWGGGEDKTMEHKCRELIRRAEVKVQECKAGT